MDRGGGIAPLGVLPSSSLGQKGGWKIQAFVIVPPLLLRSAFHCSPRISPLKLVRFLATLSRLVEFALARARRQWREVIREVAHRGWAAISLRLNPNCLD